MSRLTFAAATRDGRAMRLLKRATVVLVIAWASLALFSGFRAWVQVLDLDITTSEPLVGPATDITVTATSSGRATVTVTLEFQQGGVTSRLDEVLVVHTSRDPALDPRFKHGSATVRAPDEFLTRARAGPAVIRAVARGRSQFLRTPPPRVREIPIVLRELRRPDPGSRQPR